MPAERKKYFYVKSWTEGFKVNSNHTPTSTPISMPKNNVVVLVTTQRRKSFLSTFHKNIASS
jgi:hypothetical protein